MMKMKWIPRLLASVLALVLLLSTVSVGMADTMLEISPEEYQVLTEQAVEEYYAQLVSADRYEAYYAYTRLVSEQQYDTFYSMLTEEQQNTLDRVVEELGESFFYINPVPFTKAGPLIVAYPMEETVAKPVKMRMASRAAASTPLFVEEGFIEDSGMYVKKWVEKISTNNYRIRLEAYLSGQVSAVPSDIVLVVDESGSMLQPIGVNPVYRATVNNASNKNKEYIVVYAQGSDGTIIVKKNADGKWVGDRTTTGKTDKAGVGKIFEPRTKTDTDTSRYQFFETYTTKETALLEAINAFLGQVKADDAEKFPDSSGVVGHRIAIVGFASGSSVIRSLGTNFAEITDADLEPDGSTNIQKGLDRAITQLKNAANSAATKGQKRNKVVIAFTDGYPGNGSWTAEDTYEAVNSAVNEKANVIKNDYEATLFTVAVLSGADPTATVKATPVDPTDRANTFLHALSSNYPNAKVNASFADEKYAYTLGKGGNNGYYLSASSAGELTSIFESISESIQTPQSLQLDKTTVIMDELTDYFELIPYEKVSEQVYAYSYKYNGDGTWQTSGTAITENVVIDGNTISVSGFDFYANYVSEDPRPDADGNDFWGKKVRVVINVRPKDDFLGGNMVPTNKTAKIKLNNHVITDKFQIPKADVPLLNIKVTAPDRNVYLYDKPTKEELVGSNPKATYTTRYSGETKTIELDKTDHCLGLTYQDDYVKFSTSTNASDGAALTADGSYTFTCTMQQTSGTVTKKTATATGNIYVYKPTLTFKDTTAYYGADQPNYETADYVQTQWKRGSKLDTDVTMIGTAPKLTIAYTPDSGAIQDGKVNTKNDYYVNAVVTVAGAPSGAAENAHITFAHTACSPACSFSASKGEFMVHVKTCQLTVKKVGGNSDEPYVIKVLKDGEAYTELTLLGGKSATIKELPVGTYSIQEETDWSWRFEPTYSSAVTLSSSETSASGEITCTNTKDDDQWLNGYADVVTNTQGVSGND